MQRQLLMLRDEPHPRHETPVRPSPLKGPVAALTKDSNDRLWIGSGHELLVFDTRHEVWIGRLRLKGPAEELLPIGDKMWVRIGGQLTGLDSSTLAVGTARGVVDRQSVQDWEEKLQERQDRNAVIAHFYRGEFSLARKTLQAQPGLLSAVETMMVNTVSDSFFGEGGRHVDKSGGIDDGSRDAWRRLLWEVQENEQIMAGLLVKNRAKFSETFDFDADGKLSAGERVAAIHDPTFQDALDEDPRIREYSVQRLLSAYDEDGSDSLSTREYLQYWNAEHAHFGDDIPHSFFSPFIEPFMMLDGDANRIVSRAELLAGLPSMGIGLPQRVHRERPVRYLKKRTQPGSVAKPKPIPREVGSLREPIGASKVSAYEQISAPQIELTNFWTLPLRKVPADYGRVTRWRNFAQFHTEKTWWFVGELVSVWPAGSHAVLAEVSMQTLETVYHRLPEELKNWNLGSAPTDRDFWAGRTENSVLLVHRDRIYVKNADVSGTWKIVSQDLSKRRRLWNVERNVYLATPSALRIFNDSEGGFRTLGATIPRDKSLRETNDLRIVAAAPLGGGGVVFGTDAGRRLSLKPGASSFSVMDPTERGVHRSYASLMYSVRGGSLNVWNTNSRSLSVAVAENRLPMSEQVVGNSREDTFPLGIRTAFRAPSSVWLRDLVRLPRALGAERGKTWTIYDDESGSVRHQPLRLHVNEAVKNMHTLPASAEALATMVPGPSGVFVSVDTLAGFWFIDYRSLGLKGTRNAHGFAENYLAGQRAPPTARSEDVKDRVIDAVALSHQWRQRSLTDLRAAAGADPEAVYQLGVVLREEGQSAESLAEFKRASDLGIANAHLELARHWLARSRHELAFSLFARAAAAGLLEGSKGMVGLLLGAKVKRPAPEISSAVTTYLTKGGELPWRELMDLYFVRLDTRDLEAALDVLKQAVEKDRDGVLKFVEDVFGNGLWPDPDWDGARPWLEFGAGLGGLECCFVLGLAHQRGFDGNSEFESARKWLLKAAEGKHRRACRQLGFLYIDYYDSEQWTPSYEEGAKWLERAVKTGDLAAGYHLALMFRDGRYPERERVIDWLRSLTEQSFFQAEQLLMELDPDAANSAVEKQLMPPVNYELLAGTWKGAYETNGEVELVVGFSPRGRLRVSYQIDREDWSRPHKESVVASLSVPGINWGGFRVWFDHQGLMAAKPESKIRTRMVKVGEPDDPELPASRRIVGKWSGAWNGRFPVEMEFKPHALDSSGYEIRYRYKDREDGIRFIEAAPDYTNYDEFGANASGRAQGFRQFYLVLDPTNTNALNVSMGGLVNSRKEMVVMRPPKIYQLRRTAKSR